MYDLNQRLCQIIQTIDKVQTYRSELSYNTNNELTAINQYEISQDTLGVLCAITTVCYQGNEVHANYTWIDITGHYQDEKEQIILLLNQKNQVICFQRILLPEAHQIKETYKYDNNNNLISVTTYDHIDEKGAVIPTQYCYMYDDKKNIRTASKDNLYWFLNAQMPLHKPCVGENNWVEITNTIEDFSVYSPFTYLYDDQGYPLIRYTATGQISESYTYKTP